MSVTPPTGESRASRLAITLSDRAGRLIVTVDEWLRRPWALVAVLVAASAPILFLNAFRFALPVGYAGLYSMMAELLARTGPGFPSLVPYYGQGGAPFAYPPLGIILMALAERLSGVSALTYTRIAPPILGVAAVIALFWLAREITRSSVAAFVAGVILATSGRNYLFHIEAAGVVRGLGLVFALLCALALLRTLRQPSAKWFVLTSLLFALTVLTHLVYALFLLVGTPCLALAVPRPRSFVLALGAVLVGTGMALPWLGWVVQHFGWSALVSAAQTHGNAGTLQLLHDPARVLLPRMEDSLRNLLRDSKLAGLVVTGIVFAVAGLHFEVPLWMAGVIALIPEGDRFITVLAGILSGAVVGVLFRELRRTEDGRPPRPSQRVRGWALVAVLSVIFYRTGLQSISALQPSISIDTLDLATFVRSSTPDGATFLAVASPDEAEWLPFLFHRQTMISPWGAEWKGTYTEEQERAAEVVRCASDQSVACLDRLMGSLPEQPDLLITHGQQEEINAALKSSGDWTPAFTNDAYVLWVRVP
ncbi:MAG TPA: hypothetical protein VJ123_05085 [Anaerolineales bacterium]|nr:hypothetical protein [Anaerolineales bacterium]